MSETMHHVCINLRGALRNWRAQDWRGCVIDDSGKTLTPEEVREYMFDQLAMGRKVIPMDSSCDTSTINVAVRVTRSRRKRRDAALRLRRGLRCAGARRARSAGGIFICAWLADQILKRAGFLVAFGDFAIQEHKRDPRKFWGRLIWGAKESD